MSPRKESLTGGKTVEEMETDFADLGRKVEQFKKDAADTIKEILERTEGIERTTLFGLAVDSSGAHLLAKMPPELGGGIRAIGGEGEFFLCDEIEDRGEARVFFKGKEEKPLVYHWLGINGNNKYGNKKNVYFVFRGVMYFDEWDNGDRLVDYREVAEMIERDLVGTTGVLSLNLEENRDLWERIATGLRAGFDFGGEE